MRLLRFTGLVLVAALVGAACSSSGEIEKTCTSTSDCAGGDVCGYATEAGCGARGVCVAPYAMGAGGCGPEAPCPCGGAIAVTCVADGFTSAPTTYSSGGGECTGTPSAPSAGGDGGSDAADSSVLAEAGGPCVTDTDCAGGTRCGFPESDLCAAKGICVVPVACQGPEDSCACGGGATVCVAWGYASAPTNGGIGPCTSPPAGDAASD